MNVPLPTGFEACRLRPLQAQSNSNRRRIDRFVQLLIQRVTPVRRCGGEPHVSGAWSGALPSISLIQWSRCSIYCWSSADACLLGSLRSEAMTEQSQFSLSIQVSAGRTASNRPHLGPAARFLGRRERGALPGQSISSRPARPERGHRPPLTALSRSKSSSLSRVRFMDVTGHQLLAFNLAPSLKPPFLLPKTRLGAGRKPVNPSAEKILSHHSFK